MADVADVAKKGYEPHTPISVSPLLDWPPKPGALGRYLVWPTLLPYGLAWFGIACLNWYLLTPSEDTMTSFGVGWIGAIWLRNAALLVALAGLLQLFLYRRKSQGTTYKYNPRGQSRTNRSFLWTNQVLDNVFWSLVSGVTIWTAYEVVGNWLYANGHSMTLSWSDAPIYLAVMVPGVFIWSTLHFYLNHRLLHWGPLYRTAHSLHHKNVNTGPWSGISMHPLEHVLYFSGAALYWIIPAHPTLALTWLAFSGLSPVLSHSGFDQVQLGRMRAPAGDYFHHLHHRYFDCNYGNRLVPLDKVFGTFHDGTAEAHARMKAKR